VTRAGPASGLLALALVSGCVDSGGRVQAPNIPDAADPGVPPGPLALEPGPGSHLDFPKRPPNTLTYARDIAPLLFQHCATCHRPGGTAPFPLLTYEDVRRRATEIATVTKMRFMPPWLPAPGHGDFADRPSLTVEEIGVFQQWIFEGMAPGDPREIPETPRWPEGWTLGEPDLVLRLPDPYPLPPEGSDVFRNFVLPVLLPEGRWVRAHEFRPGNPRVVHHATIHIDATPASRTRDAEDPEPGFEGMQPESAVMPDGHFLGWSPGRTAGPYPESMSWRLPRFADVVLQLHLLPSGKTERVQPEIGFYFADGPPTQIPWMIRLGTRIIDIPAGEREYVIRDTYRLPIDVRLLAIYPHAHYLGRDVKGFATLPDGTKRWLIWIPEWDFAWQECYRYAEPVFLPRGTILAMRFTYDNSSSNLRNPHDPPRRVRFGPSSFDEMGDLRFQVVPRGPAEFETLRADYRRFDVKREIARRRALVAAEPSNPRLRSDLGHFLMTVGRMDEAVESFREAVRIKPGYLHGRRNLGAALAQQGAVGEAIEEFRRCIEIAPDDAESHAHLGNLLGSMGRLDEAMAHLRRALSLNDDLPQARYHLGLALERTGRPGEALEAYRKASEQEPGWSLPLAAAAWLEATDPRVLDPPAALRDARRAASLTRSEDPIALEALAAALGSLGRYVEAAERAERALWLLPGGAANPRAQRIRAALGNYRRGVAYRSGP
jgi:tetratricopeptide (TPR) repeat protein